MIGVVVLSLLGLTAAAGERLPRIDGVRAVASVNGEPLSLDEYMRELGEMHAGAEAAGPQSVPERDPMALLDRLVQAKLILAEARAIGLDELPEYEKPLERFRRDTLRAMLFESALGPVARPTAAEVDLVYRERVEEDEVELVLFADRTGALTFAARLAVDGAEFGALARQLVAEGSAKEYQAPRFVPRARVPPDVAAVLAGLEPGQTSEPIELASGVAVVRLSSTRVPEEPEVRSGVETELAQRQRSAAMRAYVEGLVAKRARIDHALLDSLDFDAAAAEFDKFLADTRVIVRIDGGEPLRVEQLARTVKSRMYHGIEQAAQKGRLDKTKGPALEQLVADRVLEAEARRKHLDRTPAFAERSAEFEQATLFGLFIARVIEPSIEVSEEEIRGYREAHLAELTEPEMVRVEALAFGDPEAARAALDRLDAGADLRWMRENAASQVDGASLPDELRFDGRLLLISSLAPGVRDALVGATPGSYRRYDEEGRHLVLFLRDRIAPRPRTLEEVHDELRARLFAERRESALAEFTRKLREASEIRVFVDRDELRALAAGGD
jgi:hypothetical protein